MIFIVDPERPGYDDTLEETSFRNEAILLWNANNTCGFDQIDWQQLAKGVMLTTISW